MEIIYNPGGDEKKYKVSPTYLEDESILMKDLNDAIIRLNQTNNQYAPLELSGAVPDPPEVQLIINNDLLIIRTLLTNVTGGIRLIDKNFPLDITLEQSRIIPSNSTRKLLTTIIIVVDKDYKGQRAHRMYRESLINKEEVCSILIQ